MVEIIASNFKLRPFNREDAEAFHIGINTQRIDRDTTIILPWNLDNIRWWIDFISDAALRRPVPEIHFVIEIEGRMAGSIGIINIDGHRGEIGYWLKDEYEKRGLMTEAVSLVTEFGFKSLGLGRIFAPILPHNKASARVLEKNGYVMEGVLRKFYYKNSQYIDALCYAKIV